MSPSKDYWLFIYLYKNILHTVLLHMVTARLLFTMYGNFVLMLLTTLINYIQAKICTINVAVIFDMAQNIFHDKCVV